MTRGTDGYPPRRIEVQTRDAEGRVLTYKIGEREPWTISRDAEGRVASTSDGYYIRTVIRDAQGKVESVPIEPV